MHELIAHSSEYSHHMNEGQHMFQSAGLAWVWMVFIMLVLIATAVALAAFLIKSPNDNEKNALETLKKRYASGEIDEKEYKRIKKELAEK